MMAADFDLVVVGGGIHGAGVAQAAAAAGYQALLLEKSEFAHGTSSRSSKLIHGGLRYLETGQFSLVRESLTEREILLRIAPDLVRLVPFFLPIYRSTSRRPWQVRAGLALYALLGKLKETARFRRVHRGEWEALDGIETKDLQVVFQYWDAQTDDAALTRAVVRSAAELGARVLRPAQFLSAERLEGGYRVLYHHQEREQEIRCLALVNAAGPWVNRILDLVEPSPPKLGVDFVQGAHIVLQGKVERGIYYTEAPRDRRAVFIMPWEERTLVGTTETRFKGDPEGVRPLPEEIDYLLETFHRYFPAKDREVLESFAGLRVLPKGRGLAFTRPREMVLFPDDRREPRLVTLYGGKLTAYRASAQKVVRLLGRVLPVRVPVADTTTLPLSVDGAE